VEVGGPAQSRGVYVTEDGLVFSYSYQLPDDAREPAAPCDVRKLEAGSAEQSECLRSNSQIRAKLEPSLLSALLLDLTRISYRERIEWRYIAHDAGEARLEVPGRGHDGRNLELASCTGTGASQLDSPEGRRTIGVLRRIRRALGREWRNVSGCHPSWEQRKELAPGVVAWWSPQD
jgi:hypothetical protein